MEVFERQKEDRSTDFSATRSLRSLVDFLVIFKHCDPKEDKNEGFLPDDTFVSILGDEFCQGSRIQ